MRLALIFSILLAITVLTIAAHAKPLPTRAPASESCKLITNSGPVFGKGATSDLALENAITKCVDRQEANYQKSHVRSLSSSDGSSDSGYVERGEAYIDSCINLKCS